MAQNVGYPSKLNKNVRVNPDRKFGNIMTAMFLPRASFVNKATRHINSAVNKKL